MWEYQQKTPHLSDHELKLGQQMSHGSMKARFAANREILSHDPLNWPVLDRIRKCGDPYPCQQKSCDKCHNAPLDPKEWRVDPSRYIDENAVNPVYYPHYVGKGSYRHIQNITKMIEPFYGLPVDEVAPFTIKFAVFQGGEDYLAAKQFYAEWMWEIGNGFKNLIHPGVKIIYRFEWSWTTAGQVKWDLPLRAPGLKDVRDMDPDQVVCILHVHGFAHFPGFKYYEVGQFFRMVFEGPWQVHVAEPKLDDALSILSRDMSWLTLQDPLQLHSLDQQDEHQLPDHPDDMDGWHDRYEDICRTFRRAPSIDERLDALADQYDEQLAYHVDQAIIDQHDLLSGLVGWAGYCCKDHLPKAMSRLANRSIDPDNPEAVAVTLTDEQMVIACHADAEIERALKGKRKMHSFGTMQRSQAKAEDNTPDDNQKDETDPCKEKCIEDAHHDDGSIDNCLQFPFSRVAFALHEVTPCSKDWMPSSMASCLKKSGQKTEWIFYYKEVRPTVAVEPLFHGVSQVVPNKLCLGVRVLRPP